MRAGKLKYRITVEKQVLNQNAFGETVASYTPLFTIRADVQPISGKELLAADAIQSQTTHRVRTRYRAGIDPTCRLTFGCGNSRVLEVVSAINVREENRMWEILATELRVNNPDVDR